MKNSDPMYEMNLTLVKSAIKKRLESISLFCDNSNNLEFLRLVHKMLESTRNVTKYFLIELENNESIEKNSDRS